MILTPIALNPNYDFLVMVKNGIVQNRKIQTRTITELFLKSRQVTRSNTTLYIILAPMSPNLLTPIDPIVGYDLTLTNKATLLVNSEAQLGWMRGE